ncbi:CapS: tyrosine-protein phosphatase [Desulfosarcina variabilis str. Montpellier]|uniref:tyrosine-protein phosphatase n=1 Tax=Desulfosarcina variabilis TaxID=2300 RepID=UPI003AFB79B4
MIDLHCHLLPRLDDGPTTLAETLAMARCAVADGLHTIVCTPHVPCALAGQATVCAFSTRIKKGLAALHHRLEQLGIQLRVVAGGEVPLGMPPALCQRFTINGGRYVLIEPPPMDLPADAHQTVFGLVMAGLIPIIAHPERNPAVIEKPSRLTDLIRSGALVQITGGSLLGAFGGYAQACAKYLLKTGWVSFLASDAHASDHRRPMLSKALDAAARIVGESAAGRLVRHNPQAVLDEKPLAPPI